MLAISRQVTSSPCPGRPGTAIEELAGGHRSAPESAGREPDDQPAGLGGLGLLEPGANSQQVRPSQVAEDLQGLLPGLDSGRQVTDGPAGVAELGQHDDQHPAGHRVLPLAHQGQGLPVTADRLAWLAELGVHESPRMPRHGQNGGVAGLGGHLQGLPGVTAGPLVVPQVSVACPESSQGPSLPGLVAGLPEQRQGLLGLHDRLGQVAPHGVGPAGEQVRPGLAGQVTSSAEVVHGPGQVGAILVMSAGERAVPADGRVGPAQRDLVPGGLGGGQHHLGNGQAIGPVPLAAQGPGLTEEHLPGAGDEARRGGLGDGLELNLLVGLSPVLQLRLTGQLLGQHARRGRRERERRREVA